MEQNELDKIFYGKFASDTDTNRKLSKKLNKVIEKYKQKNIKFKEFKMTPIDLQTKVHTKIEAKQSSYIVPIKYIDNSKLELERLLKEGIIKESEVNTYSPGFFIEKKNKDLRLVIDYRKLNEHIVDEQFDISKNFENLQTLGNNKYYIKIDLKNGFNQIPLSRKGQEITGFRILIKTYI